MSLIHVKKRYQDLYLYLLPFKAEQYTSGRVQNVGCVYYCCCSYYAAAHYTWKSGLTMVHFDWRHLIAILSTRISVRCKDLGDIYCTSRGIAHFVLNFVAMATGQSGKNSVRSIWWPISENSNTDAKKSRRYLLHKPNYSQFCPKFRCHGNGGRSGENLTWQHSIAHQRKSFYRRKNFLHKPSYSQFCLKFRCHGNGGRSVKMRLAAFDGSSPWSPYRRKNSAEISYTSRAITNFVPNLVDMTNRVIANFVPNFVAMATGVSRWKMQLAALDGPSPKTPL